MLPELRRGLARTLLFALLATAGGVVVPLAVQQPLDRGLIGAGGPHPGTVRGLVGLCALAVLVTAGCGYLLNYRLFRPTETALAVLRVLAFRHIPGPSLLHYQSSRPGAVVLPVSRGRDPLSGFLQW